MVKEQTKPQRKRTRLENFDYCTAGAYFITICVRDKMKILSEIVKAANDTNNYKLVGNGAFDVPQTLECSPNFTAANEVFPISFLHLKDFAIKR